MKNTKNSPRRPSNPYLVAVICLLSFLLGGIFVLLFINQEITPTDLDDNDSSRVKILETRLSQEANEAKALRAENALLKANIKELERASQSAWIDADTAIHETGQQVKSNEQSLMHPNKDQTKEPSIPKN